MLRFVCPHTCRLLLQQGLLELLHKDRPISLQVSVLFFEVTGQCLGCSSKQCILAVWKEGYTLLVKCPCLRSPMASFEAYARLRHESFIVFRATTWPLRSVLPNRCATAAASSLPSSSVPADADAAVASDQDLFYVWLPASPFKLSAPPQPNFCLLVHE